MECDNFLAPNCQKKGHINSNPAYSMGLLEVCELIHGADFMSPTCFLSRSEQGSANSWVSPKDDKQLSLYLCIEVSYTQLSLCLGKWAKNVCVPKQSNPKIALQSISLKRRE